MNNNTTTNTTEIESLYKENCKENRTKFSKQGFAKFLKFLEIDFYDWVRENLKQFEKR